MRNMVALVGEQPLPNLLPAFFLKPEAVLLVYSQFTEEAFHRLDSLLREGAIAVHSLKCKNEYEAVSITEELQGELNRLDFPGSVSFNLTGGLKAMVLAAYECARRSRSEVMYLESGRGVSRLFRYEFQSDGLRLLAQPELPALMTIDQFLNAHLGKNSWQERGYSKDIGGDFERAVSEALRGAVDEVKAGVHFLGDEHGKREQADLDLVIRVKNQFGVIEVKNQKRAALDALKQLHYLSRLLGTYTRKFWVLSREASPDHRAVIEATRTIVIELPDFTGCALSEASAKKLREKVSQALI